MYTFDHDLFLALNFDGGPQLDRIMLALSGTTMWLPLYALILWLVWRRTGWRGLAVFTAAMIAALALSDMVSGIFKHNGLLGGLLPGFEPRPRPMFTPSLEGLAITPDSLHALRRMTPDALAAAGYAGAKAVSRPRRLVLTDDDLFPAGTVTLNGYKVFGEEGSRAVSYAASVARAADSSLTPLLERQLTAEGGFHLPVEWVNYCEEGGVEANIRGETVLMGSAYFMKKRKVALPRDMKLSTGVFLAVDGALTAVFAVKYQPSRNAEWALRTLKRFHIVPVLAVRSGNVTPGLIKRKFGVDAKPVYPDVSTRLALAQLAEQQGEQPCVAICREGLMPLVESVAGSRRAVKAVRTATILSYIGAAAGVALAYYLTSVGNFALLTPIAMVLYQVLWLLPTLLLAGLVKHY